MQIGWAIFVIVCMAVVLAIWRLLEPKVSESVPDFEETMVHPQEYTPPPTPEPGFVAPFTDEEITIAAKCVWGEARGLDTVEQAAVVWCFLNRVDSTGDSLAEVVTAPHQFHYDPDFKTVGDNGQDLEWLVRDVISRWEQEKNGYNNVGRVLPPEYMWFGGDGTHNYFRTNYDTFDNIWDWSFPNPYE